MIAFATKEILTSPNGGYPPSWIFKAGKIQIWFHISNLIECNRLGVHVLHILLMDKILHHLEWTKSFPNHTFRHVRSIPNGAGFCPSTVSSDVSIYPAWCQSAPCATEKHPHVWETTAPAQDHLLDYAAGPHKLDLPAMRIKNQTDSELMWWFCVSKQWGLPLFLCWSSPPPGFIVIKTPVALACISASGFSYVAVMMVCPPLHHPVYQLTNHLLLISLKHPSLGR